MSILIDVILVIIFVLFVVKFTKNGFIISLIKLGSKWMSLFVSFVLNPAVTDLLHNLFLSRPITNGINNTLLNIVNNNPNGYNLSQMFANLPSGFSGFLNYFGISVASLEAEYGSATEATEAIIGDIADKIAVPCSRAIASVLAYIICFIASAIFFWWLRRNVKRIMKFSFFMYVDRVCGFITGTVLGLCAIFGIVAITFLVFQLFILYDATSSVMTIYENTYVFKYIHELNVLGIITNLFSSIVS